jgi:hyaluronan synthase
MRCAQSTIGAVLCSPGAISGYRKVALLPHLDGWLNQTFLGQPSHIGEDRALTSILLRNDYHVVLQHDAKVITRVPTDYPQLCRTLIRWTRGDVREGLLMFKHFIKRFPCRTLRLNILQFNLVFQLLGLILPLLATPLTIWTLIAGFGNIVVILSYIIAITWVWATIPALLYAERESPLKALLAFAVGVFNLLALSWICAYSWLTVRNSKWMTRDAGKNKVDDGVCSSFPRIS